MPVQSTSPETPTGEPTAEPGETNDAVGIAIAIPPGVALGLTVFDSVDIGILIGLAFAPVLSGFSKLKKQGDGA